MTTEQRFWNKVKKTENCWEWTGSHNHDSMRGNFRPGGMANKVSSHRFSWELHNGKIPKGLCVLHKCDNPICVNPDHLFLGTQADNLEDMTKKGRRRSRCNHPFKKGTENPTAKLNEYKVRKIRAIYMSGLVSQSKLAEWNGVTQTLISAITRRVIWTHV